MQFVNLDNIKELKTILTPYVLIALKEKYLRSYRTICLREIYKESSTLGYESTDCGFMYISWEESLARKCLINDGSDGKIYHVINNKVSAWFTDKYYVADIPKRYKYSSGMNCSNGYKESGP